VTRTNGFFVSRTQMRKCLICVCLCVYVSHLCVYVSHLCVYVSHTILGETNTLGRRVSKREREREGMKECGVRASERRRGREGEGEEAEKGDCCV